MACGVAARQRRRATPGRAARAALSVDRRPHDSLARSPTRSAPRHCLRAAPRAPIPRRRFLHRRLRVPRLPRAANSVAPLVGSLPLHHAGRPGRDARADRGGPHAVVVCPRSSSALHPPARERPPRARPRRVRSRGVGMAPALARLVRRPPRDDGLAIPSPPARGQRDARPRAVRALRRDGHAVRVAVVTARARGRRLRRARG